MKIYPLPVPPRLQPETQGFIWPPDCDDYGVEQDWHSWLTIGPGQEHLVSDPGDADWHYLPVFWNRCYLTDLEGHRHGRDWGVEELILDRGRTFIVAEYDPRGLQPDIDLSGVTVLTANRMKETGIDIPLLVNAHSLWWPAPEKQWLACFQGNPDTHPIREGMIAEFAGKQDCLVGAAAEPIDVFVHTLQTSYVALAPRGDGGQSFRFYEAMQAGTVPLLLGDLDTRPFKDRIDWNGCSFYWDTTNGLYDWLRSQPREYFLQMGKKAMNVYYQHLRYGCWCRLALEELRHALG